MSSAEVAAPTDEVSARARRGVERITRRAQEAGKTLATAQRTVKDAALLAIAEALNSETERIVAANKRDLAAAEESGVDATMLDRLALDADRVAAIAGAVREIAALPDPVGNVITGSTLANGIRLRQVRVPMGVIGVIYEARPNVTVDIAALALKSGNAVVLRGGSAAARTNAVLSDVLRWAIASVGLPADLVSSIDEFGRDGARALMQSRDFVDLLIPRGGAELIATVVQESIVPVIETGVGNVHMFIDSSAELKTTLDLVLNSKTHRPSVCNALETLLVHEKAAKRMMTKIIAALDSAGVTIHGDVATSEFAPDGVRIRRANRRDWVKEYLGLDIAVAVVSDIEEAIEHIERYSSGHTDVIVTNDVRSADRFVAAVDSAAVGVNVSSRFTDGGQFGLGAEVGISTQKLHARGPMGLTELTTSKWIVHGEGQVRE
ncbi:glutamate-5-semialdehyde dehydrogenase [Saxibacter everestensis]|uniref:Gamma-glutamyl phosphate reductase n=1 Tax=Saxibacter everestensis TaxID=2909229 RepID=A0ABY8QY47_9MICO|nr:glutamate-5-semialdehyde dehydrogenase [Brevibacteriaceae bacterium ZFBP1038]